MMFKKIASTFIIKIIIAVINLAIVVVLSQAIGAAGKGEASLIITSIAMILLFCNMIGGSSLVYFVPRNNIFQLFLLSNAWSLLVCGLAYIVFNCFTLVSAELILPVILLSLINSFLSTNLTIILGKEMITVHNLLSLLQAVIGITVLWLMVRGMDRTNIGSYLISLYASMAGVLAASCFYIFRIIKDDHAGKERGLALKLITYGSYSQAGHVMKFMSFRCTYYMLSGYSGEGMLGIFSNGVSLVESVFLISNSIATFLYPRVSNSADLNESKTLTARLTRVSILLCITALIPLLLLPASFYTWLFGSEFAGVRGVILILAPGILFYNIALVIGHYFSGTGKFSINTWANLTGLLTTVILALIIYPAFGMTEVGIISTISYFTTSAVVIWYFSKETGSSFLNLVPGSTDIKWLYREGRAAFSTRTDPEEQ
ncbi:MAG TPA: polysaccharide biosynthesis C-terminal domain-containing protein [Bacteroidia bacterium]|jgi:O-antigen/teichoic acid export membrane protein